MGDGCWTEGSGRECVPKLSHKILHSSFYLIFTGDCCFSLSVHGLWHLVPSSLGWDLCLNLTGCFCSIFHLELDDDDLLFCLSDFD